MKLIPKSHDIKEYLKADAVIDYDVRVGCF